MRSDLIDAERVTSEDLGNSIIIRVAIIDDAPYFRAAIKNALGRLPEFEVVWEAADAKQGIDMTQRSRPDVLLMDYALPGMNGLVACRTIKESQPQVQIVIFSMFADDVKREAASAGAVSVLVKILNYRNWLKLLSAARIRAYNRSKVLHAGHPASSLLSLKLRSPTHGEFSVRQA